MDLAKLLSGNRPNGSGGGFADLMGLAKEVTPEKLAEVANWGVEVVKHLSDISRSLSTSGRIPYAVDSLHVTESVTIDFQKEVGRPVNTGWIYNAGESPVQFRYQYSPAEQSGAWVPWLTIPADYQVSLNTIDIYRLAVQPVEGSGTVQIHLA